MPPGGAQEESPGPSCTPRQGQRTQGSPVGTDFPLKPFIIFFNRLDWKDQPAGRVCSKPWGDPALHTPV